MRDSHFTRQERHMILWLRLLLAAFLLAGILFAVIPIPLFHYINDIGLTFFNFKSPPFLYPTLEYWWILSLGYKGVLAYACFKAQADWLRNHHFVPLVILGKAISFLGLLFLVLFHPIHFFYIVGCLADGLLFLITWYVYSQAIKSRSFFSHTS